MKAAFQAHLNEEFEAGKRLQTQQGRLAGWPLVHLDRDKEEYERGQTAIYPETLAEIGTRAEHATRRLSASQDSGPPAGKPRRRCLKRRRL